MKYFAYGSNLSDRDLKEWCAKYNKKIPELLNPRIVKLEGYKIGFTRKSIRRGGGVIDIIWSPGDFCYGVVFDVSEADFEILDKKEGTKSDGTGAYKRLTLPDGMITYDVVDKSDFVQPTNDYVDTIIEGAEKYDLPQDWRDELKSFKK